MATYNIHGGHSLKCRGASKYLDEVNEDRKVKNKVIEYLRAEGHTVYDCTDDVGTTQAKNLSNIVSKCNTHSVDLDVSIHLNAGGGTGCEVYNYDTRTKTISDRICSNISNALGIKNRGTKYNKNYYVLANTNSLAILIECCFVDNTTDSAAWNVDKCAKAIAEGILGKTISTSNSSSSSNSSTTATTTNLYRVRKSWDDSKSQLGAYASLDNAKKVCDENSGYYVYDWNGNVVYPVTTTTSQLYRVRLTWDDVKSQVGAYKVLENAKETCNSFPGYSVFDENGNVVYTSKTTSTETKEEKTEEKTEEKNEETIVTPEVTVENISPLEGFSNELFINYVGERAKADMGKTGVLASVTIAQAILESAWGQSELSLKANNLFGMKSTLSGNTWDSEWDGKIYSKYSNEEYDGVVTSVKSDFRAYDTVEASIKDHSDYLCGAMNGSKLRYEGLKGETNYRTAIQIIKDGGYATDSGYVDKICNLIEQYNLDEWDVVEEDITVTPEVPNENESNDSELVESNGSELVNEVQKTNKILTSILDVISKILELITNAFKK